MAEFILHQHVVGWKGKLDQAHAKQSAGEVAVLMENSGPNLGVALVVGGFDDVDLELFDIPEACRFLVWVGKDLVRRKVDFTRLLPETVSLLKGCQERQNGRKVILREYTMSEYRENFQTWKQHLQQQVH